jgi:hypothetical protein
MKWYLDGFSPSAGFRGSVPAGPGVLKSVGAGLKPSVMSTPGKRSTPEEQGAPRILNQSPRPDLPPVIVYPNFVMSVT